MKRKLNYVKAARGLLIIAAVAFITVYITGKCCGKDKEAVIVPMSVPSTVPMQTPIISGEPEKETDFLQLVNLEHHIYELPDNLELVERTIDDDIAMIGSNEILLNETVIEALYKMLLAAQSEGVGKYVLNSGFRSIRNQTRIWNNRLEQDPNYGSDPYNNPLKCMPPNSSEHSTGLAIDILSVNYQSANDAYGETREGVWMKDNAHRFGFILRYPKNKTHITGVMYEPWHFRYVGVEAAQKIYEEGLCLEEYLEKY